MISERDYNNILATAREEERIEERSVMSKKLNRRRTTFHIYPLRHTSKSSSKEAKPRFTQ